MGRRSLWTMRLLSVALALSFTVLYVEAQNVVCGTGTTSKTITIDDGDSFLFKTQKAKKYTKNADCTVDYKLGSSCAKLSFICNKFNTNNKDKKRCSKGDKVTITANGKTRVFCKTKKPRVFSKGDLKVVFTSDAKKHAPGGTCRVKCAEASQTGGTGGGGGSTESDCICGLAKRTSRIVGGEVTQVNEYPWQTGIVDKKGKDVW